MDEYVALMQFAVSDRQRKICALMGKHNSQRKVAEAMKCAQSTVCDTLAKVRKRAVMMGWSPEHDMTHPVPDGFVVKGISTLYRTDDGGIQWVKTNATLDAQVEMMKAVVDALSSNVDGLYKPTKAPKVDTKSLLTVYPIADPHIGLYAWADECGEDFDCDIAGAVLKDGMDRLVAKSPRSEEALIANLGDFFHTDTTENRTMRSGNALDVDSRWSRVLATGIDLLTYLIDSALKHHKTVRVINEIGNHDDHSSVMLSHVMNAYYRNEPRVSIDMSPMHFHYYRFGKVFIGTHHGHTVKPADLGGVMATDRAKDWGETTYRVWFTGHIHHETRKEFRGYTHESKTAISAKDSYASQHGYRSMRHMEAIVYDRELGETDRFRAGIHYRSAK